MPRTSHKKYYEQKPTSQEATFSNLTEATRYILQQNKLQND